MKSKLILIFMCMYYYTINAQTIMEQYTDIYSPELLQNKGVLYLKSDYERTSPDTLYRFEVLDEYGKQMILSHTNYFILRVDENSYTGIFPSIIHVIGQDDKYYNLAVEDYIRRTTKIRYLKIAKADMASIGYNYLPLDDLINIYKHNPEVIRNVVGDPLKEFELKTRNRGVAYYLRESPNDSANFLPMDLPRQCAHPKITVISQEGYWFELELHFHFIYNGSSNPNICARSLFDQTYIGYWKANINDLNYPYLILSMLKPEYWKDFAKLVGK